MTALAEQRVAIRRVRIRSPGGDALRVRLGVDRVLGAADLRPRGLPPAAILVVRSLADPLPGRLDTTAVTAAPDWQRAVGDELDRHLRAAARPDAGVAVADAPAVLFADRSELLACLARDWADGDLLARWWWRALGVFGPQDVLAAFAETPEAVPAAIERLAAMSALVPFAARIPPAAAASLARAVASAFGAGAAVEATLEENAPAPVRVEGPPVPAEAPGAHGRRPGAREHVPGRVHRTVAPWQKLVPVSAGELAPEQEVFVGLSLALRVAPAEVRSVPFVAAVRAWRAAGGGASRPWLESPVVRSPVEPLPQARSPAARPGRDRDPGRPRVRRPDRQARTSLPGRERPVPREASAPEPEPPDTRTEPALVPETRVIETTEPEPVELSEPATAVVTGLGGLFHLVLVGQALGLYGDFSTPAEPGIRLDVWDFVTLLGRRLLRRPLRDPIWALLADLAGRGRGTKPGRGFRPPRRRTLPRSWREPFAAAGVDLERELALHRAATGTTELDRWLDDLAAYVRARLALALGVPAAEAVRLTIRRPARAHLAPTRVDVVSRLADLPIEVRRAGLDRDPGYVPAAGRSLHFHFE